MKILFLGDVVGRSGRSAISDRLRDLRDSWKVDFVVANCENATQGNGLTPAHARTLLAAGIDCITLGDHAFDQREMLPFVDKEPRIVAPLNWSRHPPGKGACVFEAGSGRRVLVVSALGRTFMKQAFEDPFHAVKNELAKHPLGVSVNASIVDIHAEATSEKCAMGFWCDGHATLVAGTHTHIPTSDARILPGGTAYISDAGMCGDYESVIGMKKEEPMKRFTTGLGRSKLEPSAGAATICGILVETDAATGKAIRVAPVRIGGSLSQAEP